MRGLGKKKGQQGYGRGEHTIDPDDDVWIDEAALKERILQAFRAADYQPPTLPSTALELVSLSRHPDVSIDQVVVLLEQDAMLAGRVLKLAQSPVYAGATGIQSLRDAVMRLGLETLRDLVLEAALKMRVFRCPAYAPSMERLRRHSSAVGHLSRLVSRYTPMEGEYAFLCGLLHDVGVAGVLVALGDAPRGQAPPDLGVLWPAIDAVHEEAGAIMGQLWELPPEIPLVIGAHHRVRIEGYPHPLAATVCLADALARELGLGLVPDGAEASARGQLGHLSPFDHVDRSDELALTRARDALQLTEKTEALIRKEAEALADQLVGDAD